MQAQVDFFGQNGATQGELAAFIAREGMLNPAFLRPSLGNDGHTYFTVYQGDRDPAGGGRSNPKNYRVFRRDQLQAYGFVTNATLRRDEWKYLDQAVLQASHIRLGAVDDLLARPALQYNLADPMATTVLEHHRIKEAMTAGVDMDPAVRSAKDRPDYDTVYTPIPVIHADFSISPRALAASRRLGNPLDVDAVQEATRVVLEKREEMLVGSSTLMTFGGGSVYTYLTHEDRNQYTLTGAWTGLTGAQILADVQGMIQASVTDRHYGPWMLYIPTAYQTVLGDDYTSGYPKSVRDRLLELEGLDGIKVLDKLPANQVVLVEMAPGTVRIINGMGIQVVQWVIGSNMLSPTEYKVICMQIPQVRSDAEGRCGIVHGSV